MFNRLYQKPHNRLFLSLREGDSANFERSEESIALAFGY